MKIHHHPSKKNERGVTILIVAISLLALMTMAALAIDVASLYQARGEAQRAADAAALAGARMFVASSSTSTTAFPPSSVCVSGVASTQAVNKQAEAAAKVNPIAGQPAQINNIQCDNSNVLNPRVTVTVQSATSPTFFSKIWAIWGSTSLGTVKATATAEAYNASGQDLPISVTNVKPWLIPNCDPNGPSGPCPSGGTPAYFINPADGSIMNGGSFIGNVLHLDRETTGEVGGKSGQLEFYGLHYPDSPAPICPAATGSCDYPVNQGDNYIDNIACTSSLRMSCGQKIGPGSNPQILTQVNTPLSGQPTIDGTKCLIHASSEGLNHGQDEFLPGIPTTINGGSNNPNPSLRVQNISRSDSVVTAMIYDGHQMCFGGSTVCTNPSPQPATIIGFLQLGIRQGACSGPGCSGGGGGGGGGAAQTIDAVVLNAVGCSPNAIAAYPPTNPISGGGSSPIPVRLVKTPTP